MVDVQENATPSTPLASSKAKKLFPELKKVMQNQGRLVKSMELEEVQAYRVDPEKFINDLRGFETFKNPKTLAKEEELQGLTDKQENLDSLERLLGGIARGAVSIAAGGAGSKILGGVASKILPGADKLKRASAFTGDLLGAAGGDVAAEQAVDAVGGLPEGVEQRDVSEAFRENIESDLVGTGVIRGGSFVAKGISAVGAKLLRSLADHTDPDKLLADALKLSDKDFIAQYDGRTLQDAVVELKDRIFGRAKIDGREKLFPDIEKRIRNTKKSAARMIDSKLGKVEKLAEQQGNSHRSTVKDILTPIDDKLDDLGAGAETKALRGVYQTEKQALARSALNSEEYQLWLTSQKEIKKLANKEKLLRLKSSDLEDFEKQFNVTFSPKKAKEAANTIEKYRELEDKVLNSEVLDLKLRLKLKRQYAKEASFSSELLKDPDKANKAQAYGLFESSVRKNLENDIQLLSPEDATTYKNLNHLFSNLKTIEPNVQMIAASERGTLTPGVVDRLKTVFTLNKEGVGGRGFLTSEAANLKAQTATTQVVKALDLYENPALIRNTVGDQGAKLLHKYSRTTDQFYTPSNLQAIRSVSDSISRGELNAPEEVFNTLESVAMVLEQGISSSEDERKMLMMNLFSNPETASLFREPVENSLSPHLKDIKSVINGEIADPSGQEQELVRQRILKDSKLTPTEKHLRLTPLNKSGSLAGFRSVPTPQPRPAGGDTAKKSSSDITKKIQSAVNKKAEVREIIKSRRLDAIVEHSRK